jgi:hypothetical protein
VEISSYVLESGNRSPASISRYSRTLTPINQAARQTLRPPRFRARCIIPGYAAKVGTSQSLGPITDSVGHFSLPRRPIPDEVHDFERWFIVGRHLQDVGGDDELGAGFPGSSQ